MPVSQRLAIALIAMILAGLLSEGLFGIGLPSYVAGLVGALTAVPVWELVRRVGSRRP